MKVFFIIIWRNFDFFHSKEDRFEARDSSYSVSSFENQTHRVMEIRSRAMKVQINVLHPSIRSHNQTILPLVPKEPPAGCSSVVTIHDAF